MKKITLLLTLCFVCTQLATSQTIITEGFEGPSFPPAGWNSFMGTNGLGTNNDWIQATAPHTGNFSAANVYENVTGGIAEDWLVTSQIDLTTASNTQLRFFSAQSYGTNYGSTYEVKVSTNSQTNHADFVTVANYNENNIGPTLPDFELKNVDLSAYDGMMVYIAFVHLNDDGDNWIIDDVEVRSPLTLDAVLDDVALNRYSYTSINNQLSLDVFNDGLTTITSLNISWDDGTNNYAQDFIVNILPGQTQTLNHATQVNYGVVEEKNITVTINSINGGADGNSANDSFDAKFATISQSGTKMVFIEEATGTWCGWCPRGAVGMEYMATNYPGTTALVAVHNADQMEVAAYDDGLGDYISGYPSGVVDRKLADVDPGSGSLVSAYNSQINEIVPVDMGISATQLGNDLTISAHATFYSNFTSADTNYRFGVIITEDGVTGTGDGTNANNLDYDQVNYYSYATYGTAEGPMGGYENLPEPVPATQMVYDHVARALLGGFNGQAGSVPAVIADGETVSYDFNYTIPGTSNAANMHIVAVLIDQDTGGVVGAMERTVTQALSTEDEEINNTTFKVFPNPATDKLNVSLNTPSGNYSLTITDMLGRTIIQQNYTNLSGFESLEVPVKDLSAGQYLITLSNGINSQTKHFIVKQ